MNSIEQLFEFAIGQEYEAFEFYSSVAGRMQNAAVRQIFEELAHDEKSHALLLENYHKDATLQSKFKAPEHDYKIAESQESPVLSIEMKPSDAIALAMKREQEASEFYLMLSKEAKDSNEKSILENLSNMEKNHKRKLENVFVNIAYPEVF